MADFIAHGSKWRIALLLVGCMAFVATGLWFIGFFEALPPPTGEAAPSVVSFVGWASILFFGVCFVAGVRQFFDGEEQLRISAAGIRCKRWCDDTIRWDDITFVDVWEHRGQKIIMLYLKDASKYPSRGLAGKLAGVNRAIAGGDVGISLTGMDRGFAEAMAAIAYFRPAPKG
jgi:hypothetical protein